MKKTRLVFLAGLALLASTHAAQAQADPCALLSAAEVQQAFPGSKPGRVDRELEKYGVVRCEWILPAGRMVLLMNVDEDSDDPVDEARTLMSAFVDPLRPDAERNVRFEKLPDVGDEAIGIVEREDKARGITQNGAVLVVRRGKRTVSLLTNDVVRRERAEALKVLSDLGSAIARRLG